MAFESPGALGCEEPTKIRRASDFQAGWEYVEAEGRAVGIQRLIGYDCQNASATFLDHSNINLAYAYSEQPVVYESQPNVAARCLAAASLVRPASFDPAVEFADIRVEIENPEMFRISLPNQTVALVAPGETTPKRVSVNEIEVEGICLRYAQVSHGLDEICGLGVTHLSGIARFSEPATFRLRRTSEESIHLTTDTGISLANEWLSGAARCVEAKTLNNEWQDVTDRCPSNSIPTQLVQEWSDCNQRTLVDFRITL